MTFWSTMNPPSASSTTWTTLCFGTSTILFAVVSIYQWNRSRTLERELNHYYHDHQTPNKKTKECRINKDDACENNVSNSSSSNTSSRNNKVTSDLEGTTRRKYDVEKHNPNDTGITTTEDVLPVPAETTTTTLSPPTSPKIIGYMESMFRQYPNSSYENETSFPVIPNARGRIRLYSTSNSIVKQWFEGCSHVWIVFLCHSTTMPSVDLTVCRLDRMEQQQQQPTNDISNNNHNNSPFMITIHVSSIPINFIHGTPILCIKPYYCSEEVPLNDFVPPPPPEENDVRQKIIIPASAVTPKQKSVKVQFSEVSSNQIKDLCFFMAQSGEEQPQQPSCLEFYQQGEDDALKLCIQEMIMTVVGGHCNDKNNNTIQMDNLIISYETVQEKNGVVATTTTDEEEEEEEEEEEFVQIVVVINIDLIEDDFYSSKQHYLTMPVAWEKPSIEEKNADKDDNDDDDQESMLPEDTIMDNVVRLKTLLTTTSSRSLTRTSSDPTMNESFASQTEEHSSPVKKREGYINVDDTGIYKVVTETGQSVISDDIILRHVDTDLLEEERRHLQRSSSDARVLKAAVDQRRQLRSVASSRLTPQGLSMMEEDEESTSPTTNKPKKQQDFHSVKSYWNEASKRNTPTNYYSHGGTTPTSRGR